VWGGIQIFDVDAKSRSAITGYGLMAEARGKGYGAEALRRITQWAFGETSLNRIALMHAVGNAASCAVATASGYQLEGTLRRSYPLGDGQLHDNHLHARLNTDPEPALS
jgi:RimJ/RimL family protein N-acetyltransferase